MANCFCGDAQRLNVYRTIKIGRLLDSNCFRDVVVVVEFRHSAHSLLLWPVAYITACTTVQAVISYTQVSLLSRTRTTTQLVEALGYEKTEIRKRNLILNFNWDYTSRILGIIN